MSRIPLSQAQSVLCTKNLPAEIHDLKTGRFKPSNSEDGLKVLVKYVEETIAECVISNILADQFSLIAALPEAPEEEERDDQRQWEDKSLASQVATLNGGCIHWYSTARHSCNSCRSPLVLNTPGRRPTCCERSS